MASEDQPMSIGDKIASEDNIKHKSPSQIAFEINEAVEQAKLDGQVEAYRRVGRLAREQGRDIPAGALDVTMRDWTAEAAERKRDGK